MLDNVGVESRGAIAGLVFKACLVATRRYPAAFLHKFPMGFNMRFKPWKTRLAEDLFLPLMMLTDEKQQHRAGFMGLFAPLIGKAGIDPVEERDEPAVVVINDGMAG